MSNISIKYPNSNNNSNSGGGIGFCGLLTVAFIILKLTGFITWSWVWVLAPLWIPVVIVLLIIIIGCIVVFIKER